MVVKKAELKERQYWDEVVAPRLTGNEEVFDLVEDPTKFALLSRALMIFPVQWNKPFGLVMTEAMACGTPVLASPRGAALEVVEDGVTGFLREGVDGIVQAIGRLDELSPEECRSRVADRFSVEAMVSGYESVI
jgi:glycosyltransferase involved in cell wall biosynthesis